MLLKDDTKYLKDPRILKHMFLGTVIYTLFQVAAVVLCGVDGCRKGDHSPEWIWVTVGRIVAIALFTVALLSTIRGLEKAHRMDQRIVTTALDHIQFRGTRGNLGVMFGIALTTREQ